MCHVENPDAPFDVIDRINDTVITYPDPVKVTVGKLLCSERSGMCFELKEPG